MWNYRVIRRTHRDGSRTFAVHEVYYDDAGRICATTERPAEVFGETLLEARADLRAITRAFREPVLAWERLPGCGAKRSPKASSAGRPKSRRIRGRNG
jgi:hypothetical protein